MLTADAADGIPDVIEACVGPQIINMPMRPLRHLLVARGASPHASRSQGAADINVEASAQSECAEFPDPDAHGPGTIKH